MRFAGTLALLLLVAGCHGGTPQKDKAELVSRKLQAIALFPTAAEVRLFVDSGQLSAKNTVVLTPKEGRILTVEQRRLLEASLSLNENYGKEGVAACFDPHHFFQYFDSDHRKIGTVSVCFCCGGIEVHGMDGKLLFGQGRLNIDLAKVKALIHAMGEPTNIACVREEG